jgi:hypothetical protein
LPGACGRVPASISCASRAAPKSQNRADAGLQLSRVDRSRDLRQVLAIDVDDEHASVHTAPFGFFRIGRRDHRYQIPVTDRKRTVLDIAADRIDHGIHLTGIFESHRACVDDFVGIRAIAIRSNMTHPIT